MEAGISQWRLKALPSTQNTPQKSSGKNKEVRRIKFRFGQLILRKIIKIVSTRCHILRLKCTIFDFGERGNFTITLVRRTLLTVWSIGSSQRFPQNPLAGSKGSYF